MFFCNTHHLFKSCNSFIFVIKVLLYIGISVFVIFLTSSEKPHLILALNFLLKIIKKTTKLFFCGYFSNCVYFQLHFRGIAKAGEPNNLSPMSPGVALIDSSIHSTLRRKQRRLVRENPGLLSAIARGANHAIFECQYQFRNQRWNCSTRNFIRGKNLFGKIVDRGKKIF